MSAEADAILEEEDAEEAARIKDAFEDIASDLRDSDLDDGYYILLGFSDEAMMRLAGARLKTNDFILANGNDLAALGNLSRIADALAARYDFGDES